MRARLTEENLRFSLSLSLSRGAKSRGHSFAGDTDRVRDLLDADQAFALLEAMTSLDGAEFEDLYVNASLHQLAKTLEVQVSELFAACVERDYALPYGLETQLRRDQLDELANAFGKTFADAPPPAENKPLPTFFNEADSRF